ncbi:capsule biosynthesis protein [Amphritea balenae]|uniref:Capsular biosynthesis protein n=1 Tax=Amphritea balenae TaxID=452629 RepID=A0A3P1SVW3_9GAMM|nr:capsular biosynthesis protein [Amphritea balenae]RRD01311.1 capsular biosynthesis protein [Amphritea balenae]GGK58276.1 capsular polysaccharide biosynthesis protein [Amphritea balenae]
MSKTKNRAVLFLQGPLSMLYKHIGNQLKSEGVRVHRINLSLGDWLHWHGPESISYRRSREEWPGFIADYMKQHDITDLVLHGDSRWYHKHAITEARQLNIQVIVTELGLIRPGWLSLEKDGLGLNSHFPDDPEQILKTASQLPEIENPEPFRHPFWIKALFDASYNLINCIFWFTYPHFIRHTPHFPLLEYPRWIPRLLNEKKRNKYATSCINELINNNERFVVFPLQLSGDFQIRAHSPFPSMREAIELVLNNFAKSAPEGMKLLIKQHPSDNGLDKLKQHTLAKASKLGIYDRIIYIDGGSLDLATAASQGMVTVNSTAGIEALQHYIPVKTLAPALYSMPKLTHQGDLSSFWHSPEQPQHRYVDALIKLLLNATQVKGALYGDSAIEHGSRNICLRIVENRVSQPGAYLDHAPRLKKADWKN